MKMILLTLLIFLTTTLPADKNWILIEPINKTQTTPSKTKLDVNLSQIVPINTIMQKASIIKQLLDASESKEKASTTDDKKWITLNKASK